MGGDSTREWLRHPRADVGVPATRGQCSLSHPFSLVLASLGESKLLPGFERDDVSSEEPQVRERSLERSLEVFRRGRLFSDLSYSQRRACAESIETRIYDPGDILSDPKDSEACFYILQEGNIEFVATSETHGEVVLSQRSEIGSHLWGLQWLSDFETPWTLQLRATSSSRLLRLQRTVLEDILAAPVMSSEELTEKRQNFEHRLRLASQSILYRTLAVFDDDCKWGRALCYEDGTRVLTEGDAAEFVYIVQSGEATVSQRLDGQEQVIATLSTGHAFGELAIMNRTRRAATVTAKGSLSVVGFDRARFLQAARTSSHLHDYMIALRRTYVLGRARALSGAGPTSQRDGTYLGLPALVTHYQLDDGTTALSNHVVGRSIYHGFLEDLEPIPLPSTTFDDPARGIRRELKLRGARLVDVFAEGPWDNLGYAHRLLIEREEVSAIQLEHFAVTGKLEPESDAPPIDASEAVACYCLNLTAADIESVANDCESIEELAQLTGATTVCGGCTPLVATMVGHVGGMPVTLRDFRVIHDTVRSYRFIPTEGATWTAGLAPSRPGQHIVVSAKINGQWVHRPYILTSSQANLDYREITVKREPYGHFSRWLFDQPHHQSEFRISPPQGNFWADLGSPEPIVCLVAGIGMTPALAMARSVADASTGHACHIDYSERFDGMFVYRDEFEHLAGTHDNISLTIRTTGSGDRLGRSELEAYRRRFFGARFFICGPPGFQNQIHQHLRSIGVADARIHTEVFSHAVQIPKVQASPEPSVRGHIFLGLGMATLLAYLVQTSTGLSFPWLEALQENRSYRLWSGSALLSLIAIQWWFLVPRLQGRRERSPTIHGWSAYLGVLAPVVFFMHSTRVGYGYMFVLSSVYLANLLVGMLDKTRLGYRSTQERFAKIWVVGHVALSIVTVLLSLLHAFFALGLQNWGS